MSQAISKITARDAGMRLSAEEFAIGVFEEPYIYERVKGRLVVMSPAGPEHRKVSRPFRRELGGYWHTHTDLVDEVDIEGWVATTPDDDRIPDICFYLKTSSTNETVPRRVPDLIYEFVSKDRSDQERDYIDKRKEYLDIGVKEYVIVDRFKHAVLVLTFEPNQEDYVEAWLNEDQSYVTPLLPGLTVNLSDAFSKD